MEINQIKNLKLETFLKDKSLGEPILYIFDLNNDNTTYTTISWTRSVMKRYINLDNYIKTILQNEKKNRLLQLIEKCNIVKWEKDNCTDDYIGNNTRKFVWKIEIEDINGNIEKKSGVDTCPNEINTFIDGLKELFEYDYINYNMSIIKYLEESDNEADIEDAAYIYKVGLGIPNKDAKKAIKLYTKISNPDKSVLQSIADTYYFEKDYTKAFEYYNKLSTLYNDIYDCSKLAYMYYLGKGTEKNLDEAIKFFTKAVSCKNNDDYDYDYKWNAYKDLIEIYSIKKDYSKLFECYNKLASLYGETSDYYQVAHMYYVGEGTEKNLNEAIKLFNKVISTNNGDYKCKACKELIEIYYIKKDYKEILKNFIIINKGEELHNFIKKEERKLIKNMKKLSKDSLSYSEIENNIFSFLISMNKYSIYSSLLKAIVYYCITVEESKNTTLDKCISYLENDFEIVSMFKGMRCRLLKEHPSRKNYSKISYIPSKYIKVTLYDIRQILEKFLKNEKDTLLEVGSNEDVEAFVKEILKYL